MSHSPLAGIRVIDLTRVMAGPFATMMLADLGADVIKVERPASGDETRGYGPPWVDAAGGISAYYAAANRNKRSIAIDLKSTAGARIVWRLLEHADVLAANFRPGVLDRLGFSWEDVHERCPRIVYGVISGYGSEGAAADKPAFDLIVQGESGVMDLTGRPDGPPTRVGITLGDETAGLLLAQGIVAALFGRERTGVGARVEVALHDALLSLLTYHAQGWWASGEPPVRRGNAHPSIVPYQTFRTADGWINVGVGNDIQWAALCEVLGRPDWIEDPRTRTNRDRVENRNEVVAELGEIFLQRPAAAWIETLEGAEVPAGRIRSVPEALGSPEAAEWMADAIETPHGTLPLLGCPIRIGDAPENLRRPPPGLGEHADEVLAEAGYAPEEITALRRDRVLG